MVRNNKIFKLFLLVLFSVFTVSTVNATKTVVNDPKGRYTCTLEEAEGKRIVEVTSVKPTSSFLGFGKSHTENDILLRIGEALHPTRLIYKKVVYDYDCKDTVTITGLDGAKGEALDCALKAVIRFDQCTGVKREVVYKNIQPNRSGGFSADKWYKPVSEGTIKGDPCYTVIIQGDIIKLGNHFFSAANGKFTPCPLKYLYMDKSNIKTIGCGSFDNCPDLETVTFPNTLEKMSMHESSNPGSYYYSFGKSGKLDKQTYLLIKK